MGTNYYIRFSEREEEQICNLGHKHVEIVRDEIHIGKSSYGWKFLFNPFKGSMSSWKDFLWEHRDLIYDEYGAKTSYQELVYRIENHQDGLSLQRYQDLSNLAYYKEERAELHEYIDSEGYRISKHKEFS